MFVEPLPLELIVDQGMIEYARNEGITDADLLEGKMRLDTCQQMSEAKLKHRTCKSKLNFHNIDSLNLALKLEHWSRDDYYLKQKKLLDPTLKIAMKHID